MKNENVAKVFINLCFGVVCFLFLNSERVSLKSNWPQAVMAGSLVLTACFMAGVSSLKSPLTGRWYLGISLIVSIVFVAVGLIPDLPLVLFCTAAGLWLGRHFAEFRWSKSNT